MKKSNPKEVVAEIKCPACEGTGFAKVKLATQPGRRIYPARWEQCAGKGQIVSARD
jgi:hypothetical protein